MKRKDKPPVPMTLAQRIEYGTTDYLELTAGYLGATPDMPGGCETVARFSLGDRRLISVELLYYLVAQAGENEFLRNRLDLLGGDERTALARSTCATPSTKSPG